MNSETGRVNLDVNYMFLYHLTNKETTDTDVQVFYMLVSLIIILHFYNRNTSNN
jgi:hypothetical protein